jgi:hypothetical protein
MGREWAFLDEEEKSAVAQASIIRCRDEAMVERASPQGGRSREIAIRNGARDGSRVSSRPPKDKSYMCTSLKHIARDCVHYGKGLKRIDYLQGKTLFKGLVSVPGDPPGCMRMVTV